MQSIFDIKYVILPVDPSTADGRNVSITSYDDRLEISWSVASSSELCEFNYVADFITDMGTHTIHTQEPSIIFTRDLFCFKGAVIIRALIQENSFEVVNTAWEYGKHNTVAQQSVKRRYFYNW